MKIIEQPDGTRIIEGNPEDLAKYEKGRPAPAIIPEDRPKKKKGILKGISVEEITIDDMSPELIAALDDELRKRRPDLQPLQLPIEPWPTIEPWPVSPDYGWTLTTDRVSGELTINPKYIRLFPFEIDLTV